MIVRTIFFYSISFFVVVLLVPWLLLAALLPARVRYQNKLIFVLFHWLYCGLTKSLWLPCSIIEPENLPDHPVIFVANHQSIFDIPLVGCLMKANPHFWLYKKELDAIPILGFLARRFGIAVDRNLATQGARTLVMTLRLMQHHAAHVILFPEGSRYSDGKVHEFLPGFALLALKSQRPVVPLFIKNTYKVCPSGSFSIRYAPLSVMVGPKFYIHPDESVEQFSHRVHTWFNNILCTN